MLHHVRLELARCQEFPEGSAAHGYELALPLTKNGGLDRDLWQKHRRETGFRRFWKDEEKQGHLTHGRQGWALVFDDAPTAEVILKAETHQFVAGEYVAIKESDGAIRTFRVASVA